MIIHLFNILTILCSAVATYMIFVRQDVLSASIMYILAYTFSVLSFRLMKQRVLEEIRQEIRSALTPQNIAEYVYHVIKATKRD